MFFLLLGALRLAFCVAFSRFMLHILYAVSAGDTGEDMLKVHEFKDMPSDVGNTSLVEVLHLETSLHSSDEAFNFGTQGIHQLEMITELSIIPLNLREHASGNSVDSPHDSVRTAFLLLFTSTIEAKVA